MKKAISVLLVLIMALSMIGCEADNGESSVTEGSGIDWQPMVESADAEIRTINETVFASAEYWFMISEWDEETAQYTVRVEFDSGAVEDYLDSQYDPSSQYWDDYCESYWDYMRELEAGVLDSLVPKTLASAKEAVSPYFQETDAKIILQYKDVDGDITVFD